MLPLPFLLFRLFMDLLIMEQCAGGSSECRKCLNLSSSSHQYTAAGERRFITTRCTTRLNRTKMKETITIGLTLLCHCGELHKQHLILIISVLKFLSFQIAFALCAIFACIRLVILKQYALKLVHSTLTRENNCHTKRGS